VAVIDNMTFQAVEERPRLAPWVGTLFALGHSLSVAVVAVGVSVFAARQTWPGWAAEAVDWAVIALLLLVGMLNLRALRRPFAYTPVAGVRRSFRQPCAAPRTRLRWWPWA